jgi:ParB family chromosome partitioning protein
MTVLFSELNISNLQAGRFQPRKVFATAELEELSRSIKESGIVQPIVVRQIRENKYEIIAGERRFRAAQMAGLSTVPCMVHHYTDEEAARIATIENINRVDLNPIETAEAYKRLIDEFAYRHDEVAAVVGKSREAISNSLRLLRLHPDLRQALINEEITSGHAKILVALHESEQCYYLPLILKQQWSVSKLSAVIKSAKRVKKSNYPLVRSRDLLQLERDLGDYLGCDVVIDYHDGKKCDLQLKCFSLEMLDGVLHKIGYKN